MNEFKVGFGRIQVDPVESVPLEGYGSAEKRMSVGIKSHLYLIALAVTDIKDNTVIMIAADSCFVSKGIADAVRQGIEQTCGVPAEHVVLSACHQHSAPAMTNKKAPSGLTYRDEIFIPGAIAAAKAAMENRAPAAMLTATVETNNLNFVRHYLMEDGTYAGNNFGDLSKKKVAHATEADRLMHLIKFVRKGQTTLNGEPAKDILLTNFQGHPIFVGSKDLNSHSDVIGVFRDTVEEQLDCHSIYFSGASGNMLFWSKIYEENQTTDYQEFGRLLAAQAIGAEDAYTVADPTEIRLNKTVFAAQCNHTEDHLYEEAVALWEEFKQTGLMTNIAEANKWFQARGYNSRFQIESIMAHMKLPESRDMELITISFGGVAIACAPYEMFCDTGIFIKENSPFAMTLVATCANGYESYMPTKAAWDFNCYEKNRSNFIRGTAEALGEEFVSMLKQLHKQN